MAEHAPPREATVRGLLSWAFYDWATSAFSSNIQTFVFAAWFVKAVAPSEAQGTAGWGWAIGLAGLVVAVGAPILGAAADQAGRRKPSMGAFTTLAVLATAGLALVEPQASHVLLALVLVALGTVGSEYAFVFYNAMLPDLVRPSRLGRWSGWGWGLGYVGGVLSLVLALLLFRSEASPGQSALDVRGVVVLTAVWYGVFALPLFLWTPDVPPTGRSWTAAARLGLRQLADSVRQARKYGGIVRFLIARLLFTDGLTTIFAFGGVYAAGTFGMDVDEILLLGIALNVSAGVGALAFGRIDEKLGARRTILLALAALGGIYAALLLVPKTETTAFWALAVALGVFVGPVQSSSRSLLAHMAPAHLRGEMFGLFAFSGKATAFVGPLLVGAVTLWAADFAGEDAQRVGLSTVLLFLAGGFVLLLGVPDTAPPPDHGPEQPERAA